jgi:predicted TIM-barrel fold metal-dependent hydrolase
MKLFDCNCSFGIPGIPVFNIASNSNQLLKVMDFCGINKALVYHASMRFDSPIIGNKRILNEIKGKTDRLIPTWAILPSQTGEQPEPIEFIKIMKKNEIKALWAFPNEHHYTLDKNTFGDLFNFLIKYKIPILVKDNAVNIGNLLSSSPDLTVIATNQGPHNFDRYLRPMIEKFPNFYIEISYYIGAYAIEDFCKKYGTDRLLFGTAFPDNCKGGAVLQLINADISDSQKESIGYMNLNKLLDNILL